MKLHTPSAFRRLYAIAVVGYLAVFIAIAQAGQWRAWAIALGLACVLLPGRLQGVLLRDLFRGRRLLDAGNAREAVPCFERMLHRANQPWRERALWLSCPVYTRSLLAMTLNDLGAALEALGQNAQALDCWERALAADPRYPLPHVNLALAHMAANEPDAADAHLEKARALGFSGGALDAAFNRAQSALARVEGLGSAPHAPD